MSRPYVSIIMGSYNPRSASQLRAAVDSIICQSWQDWELLICDDGSRADRAELLRQAAALDPRIRLLRSEQNRGLAAALNLCLAHAKGTLIARMDDDDISEPERLETQVRYLAEHPEIAWVGTQAWLFDENGIWGSMEPPQLPAPADYLHFSPFVHPSVMFRRETLVDAGGYCVSGRTLRCEDYELFMRLAAKGLQGANLSGKLLRYREGRERIAGRRFSRCFSEMLVRFQGFASLGLLSVRSLPYACKPMAVWAATAFPVMAQRLRTRYSVNIRTLDRKPGGDGNGQ